MWLILFRIKQDLYLECYFKSLNEISNTFSFLTENNIYNMRLRTKNKWSKNNFRNAFCHIIKV